MNISLVYGLKKEQLVCGTISFYNPETMEFAALGHGIVDSDTGELLSIENGEITGTEIISLTKGVSRKSRRSKRYNK